jgi:predicted permease
MTWIHEFLRRLRFLFEGSRFDRDLAEEMRLHLDLKTAAERQRGMDAAAAAASARRQFGNATQLREISRDTWGWTLADTLRQDLRYAVRNMAASPGFTATAVLSLALGIGANTAIFSIINAVMLRSLPVQDPQALVQVKMGEGGEDELSTPIWEQIRDHQQSFSGTLAYSEERFDLAQGGESHFAQGMWVSGDFFRTLGVPILMGRAFTSEDDRWGGGREGAKAVISYDFWQRYFSGDANVIGKTVPLERHPFTVIGVTPSWFAGLDVDHSFDVAIPIGAQALLRPDHTAADEGYHWWLLVMGRMPRGESLRQADERMRAITPQILRATLMPEQNREDYLKGKFLLAPAGLGFSETRAQYRTALVVLMVTVGLVLLIACANIANLLLSRAAARQRELSVRMAIGASRARIVRQLMTESLLLAALGAACGFLLAVWGSKVLVGLLSTSRNMLRIGVSPDLRLLAFTMAIAVLTALVFGLVPAIRATRGGLNRALKENHRGTVKGSTRLNFGKALVSGQVALSFVLLLGAGLFVGTLWNFLSIDPGFSRHNVLLVSATFPSASAPAERTRMYREILDRLQEVPGVVSASSSVLTPIQPAGWANMVQPEGYVSKSRGDSLLFLNRVSENYFQTMRTPVLAGRAFDPRDDLTGPLAIVINETAARHFFGAANPLGKTIAMKQGTGTDLYRVIGVVKDTKYNRLNEEQRDIGYLAAAQDPKPQPSVNYSLRSEGRVEALIPSVRAAFSGVSRDIELEFHDLETQVNESLLRPRMVALLSTVFGALALLLAMVGLYGMTNYAVAQRQGEIGIRMALGAQPRSVIWLMLRDVAALAVAGLAVGLAASLAAGHLVVSLLYGVRFNDPLQLAGAALTLAAAIALAAYLPARRAAQGDPMAALRQE